MLVGEVFLETMATGIITQEEIDWLTIRQSQFSREEEAMALKIGRLLDEGSIQIGCRLLGAEAPGRRTAARAADSGSTGHSLSVEGSAS
jgi:hypothetical protein